MAATNAALAAGVATVVAAIRPKAQPAQAFALALAGPDGGGGSGFTFGGGGGGGSAKKEDGH